MHFSRSDDYALDCVYSVSTLHLYYCKTVIFDYFMCKRFYFSRLRSQDFGILLVVKCTPVSMSKMVLRGHGNINTLLFGFGIIIFWKRYDLLNITFKHNI